ncbi:MAG: RNA ligase (ATP), partial [Betaproteobacteria bacterium]|nr:RNA ligase (ATP) [Betaproteobacteria bacterium]
MRKLASVQKIKFVRPIAGADAIECVGILGWECVSKKGEFSPDDKCVYFEIDSLLPDEPVFEFLRKACWKEDLGRYRLRTVRLRGQISQGLALPIGLFPELAGREVGFNATEILGVEKYEPPVPAQIQGDARSFSWPIGKTDETRVQQDDECGFISRLTGRPYYISLKIDGTSSSFMVSEDEYHVCGRNYSYRKSDTHSFWNISERYGIESKIRDHALRTGRRVAIQGEIVGPGIQKNPLGLKAPDLFVFNVVDMDAGRLHLDEATRIAAEFGLNFVPILERGESFSYSQSDLLELAKGKYAEHFPSAKPGQDREGIVVRLSLIH